MTTRGHLHLIEMLAKSSSAIEDGDITPADMTSDAIGEKAFVVPTPMRSLLVCALLLVGYHGSLEHTLGLGSFRLLMTGDEENMLGDLSDLVATHLPLMFMDIGSVSITQPACWTERASTAPLGIHLIWHDKYALRFLRRHHAPQKTVHEHDYLGEQPQSAFSSLVNGNPSAGAIRQVLAPWIEHLQTSQLWPLFTLSPMATSMRSTSTPLALCSFSSGRSEALCLVFYAKVHGVRCIAEGCNERTTFTIREEGGRRYHDERLAVWAQRVGGSTPCRTDDLQGRGTHRPISENLEGRLF